MRRSKSMKPSYDGTRHILMACWRGRRWSRLPKRYPRHRGLQRQTTYEQVEIYQPVDSLMAPDLQAWVYAYSTMQQVDPYVVMAICERESACTSNILGDSGRAYGMMQIQPVWIQDKLAAHGYTEADLLMAEPNITIGIEILQDFLGKGRGIEWALTAYRYGPQQANACSTSDYSAWILSRADELRRQNDT